MNKKKILGCFLSWVDEKDGRNIIRHYCNDGLFREYVTFGDVKGCLNTWKYDGWADKTARKHNLRRWRVTFFYEGDTINGDGTISK